MSEDFAKQVICEAVVEYLGSDVLGDEFRYGASFIISKGQCCHVSMDMAEKLVIEYPGMFRIVRTAMKTIDAPVEKRKPPEPLVEPLSFEYRPPPPDLMVPKITIVMPTYNQAKYIGFALDSLLAQTYGYFLIVIVDDCSNDMTPSICAEYVHKDRRVKYIRRKTNGGTGAALNDGFQLAEGSYWTWFSSDNWAAQDYLEVLNDALDTHPKIGLVYSDCYGKSKEGQIHPLLYNKDFDREKLYKECPIGIAFLYRRALKEIVGSYDERPCEDYDMHLRMVEYTDFLRVPRFLATWRDHMENVTNKVNVPDNWKNHYRVIDEAKARLARKKLSTPFQIKNKDKAKLKIAHIHPWWDSAGVGIFFVEYMSRHTNMSIRHIMGGHTSLCHKEDLVVGRDDYEIKQTLEEADILHFNTFFWNESAKLFPAIPQFDFASFVHGKKRKLIFHLHGGEWVFRPEELAQLVKQGVSVVSCSPLITRIVPGVQWIPNIVPFDDERYQPKERQHTNVRFLHTINYNYNKGKDAIDMVFNWLEKFGYKFEYQSWVRKYNLTECLERAKLFDVRIDNMTQGFIGMVGWEAMCQEQAVLARLDPYTEKVYKKFGDGVPPPIINVCGIEGLACEAIRLMNDRRELRRIQVASRQWMKDYYNPQRVCKMWEDFYSTVKESSI